MEDDNICDCCGDEFQNLYCRNGFRFGAVVEWLCSKCYKNTYGMEWTSLPEESIGANDEL